MCLAVPLKILSVEKPNAIAGMDGATRKIRIDFVPDAKAGDYVIVHAGFAIEKLSQEEAQQNLEAIREVENAYKK